MCLHLKVWNASRRVLLLQFPTAMRFTNEQCACSLMALKAASKVWCLSFFKQLSTCTIKGNSSRIDPFLAVPGTF